MREYRRAVKQAKKKAANKQKLMLEAQLPMDELIAGSTRISKVSPPSWACSITLRT